jgi:phage portal protein BeeE
MAKGFSNWLSPAFAPGDSSSSSRPPGAELVIKPDLDQVEALAPEREALWTRLEAASFLTDAEKRAASVLLWPCK